MNQAELALDGELNAAGDFDNAGTNTKQGIIADGRETAQTAIDNAEDTLNKAEATAGNAVLTAISAVESRVANYEQAIDAAAAADNAEDGEFAKFNAVNEDDISFANSDTELQLDNVTVATLSEEGEWVVAENADLSNATGFDTYLASLQAQTDAANAQSAALSALQDAIAEVVALENDDDSITAADLAPGVVSVDTSGDNAEVTVSFEATVNEADLSVSTIQGVDAPAAPQVVETSSSNSGEDEDTVIFTGLTAGQSVTVGGKTVTADSGDLTAAQVANLFAGDDTGLVGWTAAATATGTASNEVVFTSTDSALAEKAPIAVSTAGSREVATVTFVDLVAGQSATVAGRTVTATADMTAAEVAIEFGTGDNSGLTGWTASEEMGVTVTFTSDATDNVEDISAVVSDFGATAPEAQAVLDARTGLENAELALQDLNDAVTKWEAAVALDTEVTALETAVTDARDAIENTEEEGGLGITLLEDDDNFTVEDDVYLFNEVESADESLVGFGTSGEDKIFFGEGFSLVEITGDQGINGNLGDASALEIFWEQEGNNVNLYVETETFGGSASGVSDVVKVTLTGVDAANINDELSAGFLTSNEVA